MTVCYSMNIARLRSNYLATRLDYSCSALSEARYCVAGCRSTRALAPTTDTALRCMTDKLVRQLGRNISSQQESLDLKKIGIFQTIVCSRTSISSDALFLDFIAFQRVYKTRGYITQLARS